MPRENILAMRALGFNGRRPAELDGVNSPIPKSTLGVRSRRMPDYALMNQYLYEGKAKEVEQMTKDALAEGRTSRKS